MKRSSRLFFSAVFLLCGIASFAAIPWIEKYQLERLQMAEPYFLCPVAVVSDRVLIRNDAFGKGRFGATRGNKGQRSHKGVDLLAKVDSPIRAAKSGRVRFAGTEKGYGWYIELQHPDGRKTRYAHLNRLAVAGGDWVDAGQEIGLAGKSGNARDPRIRPHLHFEIREGERALDPLKMMEPSLKVR